MQERKLLKEIRYLIIDVDGTLTDAGIYYDENGNELKKFSTKDAAGFFAAHKAGIKIIILTGRKCAATERRMKELQVEYLIQDCRDKVSYIRRFMNEYGVHKNEMGYLGDDLNDLPGMALCSFVGCPRDSCEEVKAAANYVSDLKGGYGAVRDIIEFLLKERGEWKKVITEVYGLGI